MGDLREELQQEIDRGQVTLIIGAGVSMSATAFDRWRSLDFRDATSPHAAPKADALGLAVFADFPDAVPPQPEKWLDALDSQWPHLRERMAELAPQGRVFCGFHDETSWAWARRIAAHWPGVPRLVDSRPPSTLDFGPLSDPHESSALALRYRSVQPPV